MRETGALSSASPPADHAGHAAAIRRETWQLAALMVVAVAAFFATRSVAGSNREMSLSDAAEWYRRGQVAMAAHRLDEAVGDFRRATVRNRTDQRYVLALARALAMTHDDEGARAELLSLRESTPEDPEINIELARLAAGRQDVTEALRFYHSALYAPWPPERDEQRRAVRLELIELLLTHNQASRAASELVAITTDLPDDAAHHLRVAPLFARAGDTRGALRQFEAALRLAPDNATALAGAGQAAFALGDYTLARRYLARASPDQPETRSMLEIADLVLSRDPLANRIGSVERRRRLTTDFSYAADRLNTCVAARGAVAEPVDADLQRDVETFRDALTTPGLEQDTIESGIDLIDRVERRVVARCGPATADDSALLLIAHAHADTP